MVIPVIGLVILIGYLTILVKRYHAQYYKVPDDIDMLIPVIG